MSTTAKINSNLIQLAADEATIAICLAKESCRPIPADYVRELFQLYFPDGKVTFGLHNFTKQKQKKPRRKVGTLF
jgi:hypothetical protein